MSSMAHQCVSHVMSETSFVCCLQQIFRPPLDIYDVIIHLRNDRCAQRHLAVDISEDTTVPKYKPVGSESAEQARPMPVYDFDPVQLYVHELQVCAVFTSPSVVSQPFNCCFLHCYFVLWPRIPTMESMDILL